ncbi:Nuclear pore complex protein [Abeliophyllum distichum]|uniref:Nuclear pore complex protein n=1 Tax=Abeliophyllum distichum TaxID=126358 RepID=A0ABD1Q128_9LAMI
MDSPPNSPLDSPPNSPSLGGDQPPLSDSLPSPSRDSAMAKPQNSKRSKLLVVIGATAIWCLNTEDGGVVSLDWPANLVLEEESGLGGGQLSWMGRGSVDQQRQRILMLKQLLAELLLHDGGIYLLLGPRGVGEGQLGRFLTDWNTGQQFLLEAARQCQDAGLYDKVMSL